jgi:hypothetical protein
MRDYFIPNIRRTPNPYDGHQLVTEIMDGHPCLWSYKHQFKFGKKTYAHGLLIRSDKAPMSQDYDYLEEEIIYPKTGDLVQFELVACATERQGIKHKNWRKRVHLFPHRTDDIYLWLYKRSFDAGFELKESSFEPEKITIVRKGIMFDMNHTVYEGVIEVINEEQFRKTLEQGLGSAHAFGFGLLTIQFYKQ